MQVYDVEFPVTDGVIAATMRDGFAGSARAYASGVTVQKELPATKTRRMVTVRNDGGPSVDVRSRRRYGVNVFADSSVDAERLANYGMFLLRRVPGIATSEFSGPYEIDDDPPYSVGGKNLTHFYFTFTALVRGQNA